MKTLTGLPTGSFAATLGKTGTALRDTATRTETAVRPSGLVINGLDADPWLLIAVLALLTTGFVMVSSASIDYAARALHDPFFFAKRHLIYLLISVFVMSIPLTVPMRVWQQNAQLLLFAGLLLMVLVLVPGIGRRVNGSQRWIAFAGFTLQVSEFMKLGLLCFLSDYFVRNEKRVGGSFLTFVKPLFILGIVLVLLLMEPDFGTAVVMMTASMAIIFVAGIPLVAFSVMGFSAVALAGLAVWMEPYRLKRLTTFTDPWAEDVKFDSGYQLTQSLIAFGRGEWTGVGLGNSIQKLFYLPEAHTDFVFSIWAEEFGLLGVACVMLLFAVLLYRMLKTSMDAYRLNMPFIAYLVLGFACVIGSQAVINMGVASGMLPTKGLTLPFLSYGGSSLMVCSFMVGVVLRAHWEVAAVGSKSRGVVAR